MELIIIQLLIIALLVGYVLAEKATEAKYLLNIEDWQDQIDYWNELHHDMFDYDNMDRVAKCMTFASWYPEYGAIGRAGINAS